MALTVCQPEGYATAERAAVLMAGLLQPKEAVWWEVLREDVLRAVGAVVRLAVLWASAEALLVFSAAVCVLSEGWKVGVSLGQKWL